MLPPSHVAYTLVAFDELQKRSGRLNGLDFRLVALAAMGPDLIDKPLAALYFYRRYKSAVLFAHTLIAHVAVLLLAVLRAPHLLAYALAFNGHAVLDRLWFFHDTWYWPLRGWRFHVWGKQGSEQRDIRLAYWYAFTRRPELWGWEAGGALAALYVVLRHRLWRGERLLRLLQTGRLDG